MVSEATIEKMDSLCHLQHPGDPEETLCAG